MKKSWIPKLAKSWKQSSVLSLLFIFAACSISKDDDDKKRSFDLGDGTYKIEKIESHTSKVWVGIRLFTLTSTKFTHGSEPFGLIIKWNEDKKYFDVQYTGSLTDDAQYEIKCQKEDFQFSWDLNSDGTLKHVERDAISYADCPVAPFDYYWNADTYSTFKVTSADVPDGFIIEIERKNPDYGNLLITTELVQSQVRFTRIAK